MAGRLVATLPVRTLPRGVNTLLWSGRSNAGSAAPKGRYLLTIEALSVDGRIARAVAPLAR